MAHTSDDRCKPGALWYATHDGKPAIMARLPDGNIWCSAHRADDGRGWTVTGTAPDITVTPSIDDTIDGTWHGHIIGGVMQP
jgi:hypothetical protein